jgi:hypothetical protein
MTSITRATSSTSSAFSQSVTTQTQGIRAGDGGCVRIPPHETPVPADSFKEVDGKKKPESRGAQKKDKQHFKLEAKKGKPPEKVDQAQSCGKPAPAESCCQGAAKQIESAIGDLCKKLDGLLKGGFEGVLDGCHKLGGQLGDIRGQLDSDAKKAAGGSGAAGGTASPESPPRAEGCGDPSDPQAPGGPSAPQGPEEQIQKLVEGLSKLLEQLQDLLGQKGCSSGQQDQALQNVAKGCGAPVSDKGGAHDCIRAVCSSFSSICGSFAAASSSSSAAGSSSSSAAGSFSATNATSAATA